MDRIGLVNSVYDAAGRIDLGRKGIATRGKAEEGRISYETGIAKAMTAFQEAETAPASAGGADPQTVILAEYTFLTQELEFCEKSDKDTINSLSQALKSFDDAFLALQVVEEDGYKTAEKTYPHHKDYRVKDGYPKDAFHIACESHKTRIKNILRATGIDPIEKALLKQRLANLSAAQGGYIEKQKKALAK